MQSDVCSFLGARGAGDICRDSQISVNRRFAFVKPDSPLDVDHVDLNLQLVARQHGTAETRVRDTRQKKQRSRFDVAKRHVAEHAAGLRHRLDDEHARHDRLAREMTLEERFVDGDVLKRGYRLARVQRGNSIDEEKRIPMRQRIHYAPGIKINRHYYPPISPVS